MVGLVIVSHSAKIAEGTREFALEMVKGVVPIYAVGGVEGDRLGTDVTKILEALQAALAEADDVLVLGDLGSSLLGARTAIELLDERARQRVRISQAALVEGAVIAAIEASVGKSRDEVEAAAQQAVSVVKSAL